MPYQFKNPGKIRVRQRTADQPNFMDISGEEWRAFDGGRDFSINWGNLPIIPSVKEFLKAYLAHRLSKQSIWGTYSNDGGLIRHLSKSPLANAFPWSKVDALSFLGTFTKEKDSNYVYAFKSLYRWCTHQNIDGFSHEILISVMEYKIKRRRQYEKIFLSQTHLTDDQEQMIIDGLNESFDRSDYYTLLEKIILQLCFELAPRPIQLYTLDVSDFNVTQSPSGDAYYSLNLPMAKKRANDKLEKRHRRISKQLGEKISLLIEVKASTTKNSADPLFTLDPEQEKRIPSQVFSEIIISQLYRLGLPDGSNPTLLRHHLAQSLADQGASAETIAELLGHNSTLPARAYIAATPKIAAIKTRALGKNGTYKNIMSMLITGDIVDRNETLEERSVRGMVGSQYIGGIGACGLSENTACPKNPVYSCYTCHKFHPFQDGAHEEVKIQLQKQAQLFIDVAEKSMQLGNNRAVLQLEKTIEAVDSVILRIEESKQMKTS
jgi:hypothetical protein